VRSDEILRYARNDKRENTKVILGRPLGSLTTSEKFGPMMAAEADSRGFYQAAKQAFVCDGLPYN